ncbi:MAG: gamma carbonic anhydrase family protein [Chloroflexi bacterium]|nr:gamma carbonic anhydrase family protein [Chloroflexota bacterium]
MIRSVNGKTPKIHPGAFVSEAAYVVGDVEIGDGSSVWPGTVIRGDSGKITIGKRTCIQDNSVVHGDAGVRIGDDVVIGHRVLCHAKQVGNGTLLGNGCIANDGVVIGEESLVASGAMIVDRMEIPARSVVVGMPARVRREVTDKDLERIKGYREIYIRNTAMYKAEGGLASDSL